MVTIPMLGRIYFFVGLVVITICAVLFAVADPREPAYANLEAWAMLGALTATVSVVLSIECLLLARRLIKPLPSIQVGSSLRRKDWIYLAGKGVVIALFSYIAWGIVISGLFGDEAYERMVVGTAGIGVPLLGILAVGLSIPIIRKSP
jgi:hypothetical protein